MRQGPAQWLVASLQDFRDILDSMIDARRLELMRTLFFSLWGLITLILLFTVGFLVIVMAQKQQQLTALEAVPEGPFPTGTDAQGTRATRDVKLFFAQTQRTALAPEIRRISITERTVENCREALEALIEGPRERLGMVLPPTAKIRGLYLLGNGELVVDFSRDLEAGQPKSASAELIMAQAVATSLCQAALRGEDQRAVLSVRFLFEGSPAQDTFPVHIDLSAPVRPDEQMLDVGAGGVDNV